MSKVIRFAVMAALFAIMAGSLSGCNSGSSDSVATEEAAYEVQTFDYGENLQFSIHGEEIRYDSKAETDVFVLYITATVTGEEPWKVNTTANVNPYQGEEKLIYSSIKEPGGDYLANSLSAGDEEVQPGDSIELVYAWELIDESPVVVSFGGYSASFEPIEIEFDLSNTPKV